MRHNPKDITIYSATIPSSTATIDEVSYVIADTAGLEEMMDKFKKGKDISEGVTASSISEDIERAGGNTGTEEVGTVPTEVTGAAEDTGYYEEY